MIDHSTKLGADRRSMMLEIKKEGRLKKAKSKKEKLLMYLDRWWTTLEGGEPDLEVEMEPLPTQRGGKRKKNPTKKDKIREEERQAAEEVAGSMLDTVMGMLAEQHDCGYSTACPGWWCEMMARKKAIGS